MGVAWQPQLWPNVLVHVGTVKLHDGAVGATQRVLQPVCLHRLQPSVPTW